MSEPSIVLGSWVRVHGGFVISRVLKSSSVGGGCLLLLEIGVAVGG